VFDDNKRNRSATLITMKYQLSYCRDSARRLSACHYAVQGHSKSLILVQIWKPVYDCLLVNNANFGPTLHCFPGIAEYCQIIIFDKGCLLLTHSLSVISANIAIVHILPNWILSSTFSSKTVLV